MKLRVQILLLVCLPLLALGGITYTIGADRITSAVKDTIERGLISTAIAVKESISIGIQGKFHIDENGQLWKGEALNISQSAEIADEIKNKTGMEVTVFFGETRYMTSVVNEAGERVIGTNASGEVIDEVLGKGQAYFAENVDVAGEKFFAYYLPVFDDDSTRPVGMVFTGMSQEKAETEIAGIIYTLLTIISVTIFLCICIAWLISNGIVKGVKSGVRALEEVANGNLAVDINLKYSRRKDEIGEMVQSVIKLKNEMIKLIKAISDKSILVFNEAETLNLKAESTFEMMEQMDRAVSEIAEGAGSQANETQLATEYILVMGNMVEETGKEVKLLSHNSNQIKETSDTAADILNQLNKINNRATDSIEVIYRQTHNTNKSALKIKEVTDLITFIADETNLLSLNAAIEAARAGEHGRGFSVVAAQIQKLAEQTNKSVRQIDIIISNLIQDSEKAVLTMNEIREIINEQNQKLLLTDKNFNNVKSGIYQSINSIKAIEGQTRKLDDAREKVIDGVQNLTAIAEENAASTQETAASVTEASTIVEEIAGSAGDLRAIAEELKQSINLFKL